MKIYQLYHKGTLLKTIKADRIVNVLESQDMEAFGIVMMFVNNENVCSFDLRQGYSFIQLK